MAALQAKLMAAEEGYKERLAAETELLQVQLSEAQRRERDAEAAVAAERDTTADLQDQLGRREHMVAELQQQLAEQAEAAARAQAAAPAAAAEDAAAQSEELRHQLAEARREAEAQAAAVAAAEARSAELEQQLSVLRGEAEAAAASAGLTSRLQEQVASLEQQLRGAAQDKAAALEAAERDKAAAVEAAAARAPALEAKLARLQHEVEAAAAAAASAPNAEALAAAVRCAEAAAEEKGAALAALTARFAELEKAFYVQQDEHEALEKQMTMELTMAERQAQQAQQAVEQVQAAHAAELARAQAAARGHAEDERRAAELEAKVGGPLVGKAGSCTTIKRFFDACSTPSLHTRPPLPPVQVEALQSDNARLLECERETAAELSRRLTEIAARGQQAADTIAERDLLSSAVATVQVCGAAAPPGSACEEGERGKQ